MDQRTDHCVKPAMRMRYRRPIPTRGTNFAKAVSLFGDSWTLEILHACMRGTTRFDNFVHELGISRNILAERLATMTQHGLLIKRTLRDGGRRQEYVLSQKGSELCPMIARLEYWSAKYPL